MKTDLEYEDFNIYDINSILGFIKENFIQLLLLLLVAIIIYIVDYISNINAMIFSMPLPIIGVSQHLQNPKNQEKKPRKKTKNI
jgi:hypothetical protein